MANNIFGDSAKKWWMSKTLWVNILALAAEILFDVSGHLGTEGTISALVVVNIALRVATKQAVKW